MALPVPEPGLVISYSFLWRRLSVRRRAEGSKARPCVIVLSVTGVGDTKVVTVAPLTHQVPADGTPAIEIPQRVKKSLGLDQDRSWVILDELNQFSWPGFDLSPVARGGRRFHYGHLPPILHQRIVAGVYEIWKQNRGKLTVR